MRSASGMRVLGVQHYLPEQLADNDYLSSLTGRPADWFQQRTGIRSRHRAGHNENTNTMGICATEKLFTELRMSPDEIDLIVGASYTPWDTVGTLAHRVQRHFHVTNCVALYISTACSSFLNALEIVDAFMVAGRCRTALIVTSEHNSAWADDTDAVSGHLWGDGAAAMIVSNLDGRQSMLEMIDVHTSGLAYVGKGPDGVYLTPAEGSRGLVMPHGKDVFSSACRFMVSEATEMLARQQLAVADLSLFVPHQANLRILENVREALRIPEARVAITVDHLGNTGCASIPITLSIARDRIEADGWVLCTAFGGGYSVGSALFRRPA